MARLHILLMLVGLAAVLCGCQPENQSPSPGVNPQKLNVIPVRLDLGTVEPASQTQTSFLVRNTGRIAVEVDAIHSSCGCLTARMPMRSIAPGDEVRVETDLDLSDEPRFSGSMDMELTGRMPDGNPAFRLPVCVRVLR